MKKMAYFVGGVVVAVSVAGVAGSLTVPHSFTENTVIKSSEMNANFTAVKDAVDDNDGRITTNTTDIGNLTNRVDALETNASCPTDMVQVGPICVDKYEASVWSSADGTGTQYGVAGDDYASAGESSNGAADGCQDNGEKCGSIYAVSKGSVTPSTNITWFQAQQACANVGKRLLTNAEWQMAAAGTDPTACNRSGTGGSIANTGASAGCVSGSGAFDMVGNVHEWVADWAHGSAVSGDTTALTTKAIRRGGSHEEANATIFTYFNSRNADGTGGAIDVVGFRCAK